MTRPLNLVWAHASTACGNTAQVRGRGSRRGRRRTTKRYADPSVTAPPTAPTVVCTSMQSSLTLSLSLSRFSYGQDLYAPHLWQAAKTARTRSRGGESDARLSQPIVVEKRRHHTLLHVVSLDPPSRVLLPLPWLFSSSPSLVVFRLFHFTRPLRPFTSPRSRIARWPSHSRVQHHVAPP